MDPSFWTWTLVSIDLEAAGKSWISRKFIAHVAFILKILMAQLPRILSPVAFRKSIQQQSICRAIWSALRRAPSHPLAWWSFSVSETIESLSPHNWGRILVAKKKNFTSAWRMWSSFTSKKEPFAMHNWWMAITGIGIIDTNATIHPAIMASWGYS